MIKIFYENIEVANITTNKSLNVDEALELIDFDEQKFIEENGFDDIDYNDFNIVTGKQQPASVEVSVAEFSDENVEDQACVVVEKEEGGYEVVVEIGGMADGTGEEPVFFQNRSAAVAYAKEQAEG